MPRDTRRHLITAGLCTVLATCSGCAAQGVVGTVVQVVGGVVSTTAGAARQVGEAVAGTVGDVVDEVGSTTRDAADTLRLPKTWGLEGLQGELLALNLSAGQIDALRGAGFSIQSESRLDRLGLSLFRVQIPAVYLPAGALKAVLGLIPNSLVDVNPIYRLQDGGAACRGTRCYGQTLVGPASGGCDTPPRIGMLDSAVATAHPSLLAAKVTQHHLRASRGGGGASYTHGTAVASLLVGQADGPVAGLLPGASLHAANVMYRSADGELVTDAATLVEGLDWLVGQQVQVINMSIAGKASTPLGRAVQAVQDRGIAIVAAVGNNGRVAEPAYPAAYDTVIGVTAVDRFRQLYADSIRGRHVDVAAPGVQVWAASNLASASGEFFVGTSYAAPFVTAAVASLLQAGVPANRRALVKAMAQSTQDLGHRGRDNDYGWGLLQGAGCRAGPA